MSRQTATKKQWAVIEKYGRPRRVPGRFANGPDVSVCRPSQAELRRPELRREGAGTDFKVIYDSQEQAEACAAELVQLGAAPQRAYRCGRSRRGHYHLTVIPERPKRCVPPGT